MFDNWQYRLLAVLLALVSWYMVSGQEKVETWLEVPLEFVNLPPQMEVTSGMVNKIQVRIRGTSNQVRSLNAGRLAYKLDLARLQPGKNVIPMLPENMAVPSAVEVVEISPSRLDLVTDVVTSKVVPVQLDWSGHPGPDMEVRNATVTPSQVTIQGFASAVNRVDRVSTVRIQIPADGQRLAEGRVKLLLPKDVQTNVSSVGYALHFAPIAQELWVKMNLEPVYYDQEYSYTFDPKFVRVKISIPVQLLRDKDWRETLHLVLDPGEDRAEGVSRIRPKVVFPPDVELLESKPDDVEINVRPVSNAQGLEE